MLTADQRQNLQSLRNILIKLNPGVYYHNVVIDDCGTPCCAFGWAAYYGVGGLQIVETPFSYEQFAVCIVSNSSRVYGHTNYAHISSDVFGPGAWNAIFSSYILPGRTKASILPSDIITLIDDFVRSHDNVD